MSHLFDELSKSLDSSLPRRESLRRLGAAFAGAVLSPLGMGIAAAAARDPCKTFCKCSNTKQQNACLATCRACNNDPSRVCGRCGTYACCSGKCCGGVCSNLASDANCGACGNNCAAIGEKCCGGRCADLDDDFFNCGACGNVCDDALPYEYGACFDGTCFYDCVEGAVDCSGVCTDVSSDPNNCGACGHVCPDFAPDCVQGLCQESACPPDVDLLFDALNCGACGHQCQPLEFCSWGQCEGIGG
jgi:hypothetical protein